MPLTLHNPHSVVAALETRPKDVIQVSLPRAGAGRAQLSEGWDRVAELARAARIPIVDSIGSRPRPNDGPGRRDRGREPQREASAEGGRESGATATVREREGLAIEELFADANDRAAGKGLWLALDSLQDPHNVGAIFRAASFFGVQGIVLTQERSAPMSGTVYDVSSGGVEHVPFTLQTNLQRAFEAAKEAGLWILGSSEHAREELRSVKRDRPWLLVLGNEEKGMRRLTEESCDVLCKIPCLGGVTSLNVSVAAGILIHHLTGAE